MSTTGKILYSVDDLRVVLGIGRSMIFEMFKSGELKAVKVGRRTLVHRDEVQAFADRLAARNVAA